MIIMGKKKRKEQNRDEWNCTGVDGVQEIIESKDDVRKIVVEHYDDKGELNCTGVDYEDTYYSDSQAIIESKEDIREIPVKHYDDKEIRKKKDKDEWNCNGADNNKTYCSESQDIIETKDYIKEAIKFNKNNLYKKKNSSLGSQSIKNKLEVINYKNKGKINCYDLSKSIMKKIHFIYYSGALYYYDEPIYKKLDEHTGKILIRSLLHEKIIKNLSDNQLVEILKLIKTTPEIQRDEFIKYSPNKFCFHNVVYSMNEKRLSKHTEKNIFFSYVNVDYDPYDIEYGKTFEKYINTCTGMIEN